MKSKHKYTTLFWDVDGTLLDFMYSQKSALAKCFQNHGLILTEEMLSGYSAINDKYWKKYELGQITKDDLLLERFHDFFKEYNIQGVEAKLFLDEYEEALGSVFSYIDDSWQICSKLYGRVKQYVVTNGVGSTQNRKLELSGLAQYMDDIFVSENIGYPKPEKAFFDYCFDRIEEKDKSKILIIGDSITSDIKGGVLCGIDTCWYCAEGKKNDSSFCPDYMITNLQEVLRIVL